MTPLELKLTQALDRLALAIVDAEYAWSPVMRETYEEATQGLPITPLESYFSCPYCGNEHESPNGAGTDINCCGETGHADLFYRVKPL
jgi:hypothetical protein